ncbi:MAG: RNA 3'-terminal phosphate cyclase [Candidatus Aenigmatarchaeota archaeon]
MIEIDGSYGSGGGAVLRTAIGLSIVTGKPVKIFNIRKNRLHGGLKAQHLEGLKAAAELCSADLKGAEPNSTEVEFHPKEIKKSDLKININTAGSVGLVFQILKLIALKIKEPIEIEIEGGATFGKWAPPLLTTKNILLSVLEKMGYKASINIEKHGFFPVGGAHVEFKFHPCKELKPLNLTEIGNITHTGGMSIASVHLRKSRVAERQTNDAVRFLKSHGLKPMIKEMYVESDCPGSGIVLWASDGRTIIGSDCIGEKSKKSEDIGFEAAESLYKTIISNSGIDPHISDQLLVFMALAKGVSTITTSRLSNHTKTNIWVIKKFLDVDFDVVEKKNVLIRCSGSK